MTKNSSELWDKVWLDSRAHGDYRATIEKEIRSVRWNKIVREIRAHFGSFNGLRVIEIGSGRGTMSLLMAAQGALVTLLDYSPEALAQARDMYQECNLSASFLQADIMHLPPDISGQFDISMSFGVAEHFSGPEQQQVFNAHRLTLAAHGMSFISVPNKRCLPYTRWKQQKEKAGTWEYGPETPFTPESLAAAGKITGFSSVEISGSSFIADLDRFTLHDLLKRLHINPEIPTFLDNRFGYALTLFGYK